MLATTTPKTKHSAECRMAFGRPVLATGCARCVELAAGAPARKGWGAAKRERLGNPLSIIGDAGDIADPTKPSLGFPADGRLVKVRHHDDDSTGWNLAERLRADGGWNEIVAACDAAPKEPLSREDLATILRTL